MNKNQAKLLFMGTPDFAATILEGLIQAGYEVVQVVTQPDRPRGRGKKMAFPAVKEVALAHDIPVWQPSDLKDPSWEAAFKDTGADMAIVAAYGRILPKPLLDTLPLGFVNVHASLLPAYRGAAPIQWAIRNRDAETGVSLMQMDEGMDTGAILAAARYAIRPDETTGSLFDALADLGLELLLTSLPELLAGRVQGRPQEEAHASYAPMFHPDDERIDWSWEADRLEAKLRSFLPETGNTTFLDGQRLKIFAVEVLCDDDPDYEPGQIRAVDKKSFTVQTGQGGLKVLEVQPPGKRRMPTQAYLNGNPLEKGSQFDRLSS